MCVCACACACACACVCVCVLCVYYIRSINDDFAAASPRTSRTHFTPRWRMLTYADVC